MSSLFRDLIVSANALKPNKNEALIFNALMMQTLGYSKADDNLTDKRLAKLTGIRLDHLRAALDSFLDYGLFDRVESDQYDYCYSIGAKFLAEYGDQPLYTPSLPKTGQTSPETSPVSGNRAEKTESRGHTYNNLNIKKPLQQTTHTSLPIQPPPQKNTMTNHADVKIILPKTEQTLPSVFIQTSGQTMIEIAQYETNSVASVQAESTPSTTTHHIAKPKPVTEQAVTTAVATPTTTTEIEPEAEPKTSTNHTIDTDVIDPHSRPTSPTETTTVSPVVVEEKVSDKKPLTLPDAISAKNQRGCLRYFQPLNEQQQRDVLEVFEHMLQSGKIRNSASYFVRLCKSAKEGKLTVVTATQRKKKPSAEQIAAEKERERRINLWSDFTCIQQMAQLQNIPMKEVAEIMSMEEAYELFGETEIEEQEEQSEQACVAA